MAEPQQFAGKTVAVTGGASGIGLATAYLLASRGANLSLADLQDEGLKQAKDSIVSRYPERTVLVCPLDVRNYEQVEQWITNTTKHFGKLDGAANLAGVVPKSAGVGEIVDQDLDEWDLVIGVNLTGVMHCLRAELRVMSQGGAVVNASSIAGVTGRAKNAAYTASKHGVLGLTRAAAKEVGVRGVRVNAMCPGTIKTPMLQAFTDHVTSAMGNSETEKKQDRNISLGRMGEPEEAAKLIAFLLSEESSYMSGASVSIDGGWNC